MADTFRFGQENDDNVISSEEDCLEGEEWEYDARNDETFGTLDDSNIGDDWEEQHEHFAELAENSKHNNFIETSINKLGLNESNLYPASKDSVWAFKEPNRNGEILGSPVLSKLQNRDSPKSNKQSPLTILPNDLNKAENILTLQEIEKHLLEHRSNLPHSEQNAIQRSSAQITSQLTGRVPPGFQPPPGALGVAHHGAPQMVRLMAPAHFMHPGAHQHGPAPPPGFYPPPNQPFPMNRPLNFPLPLRVPLPPRMQNMAPHPNMHMMPIQNHNEHHRRNYKNNMRNRGEPFDEYAGLMSNREKQWLINIQLVQLNTGTPYFDDYYYMIFKERKLRNIRENQPHMDLARRQNNRRNSDNTLTPRVYTPQQFENSLGKLQCGSVTAPRKIIDMDIVTPEKDNDSGNNSSRDTKKTKQMLLEVETLYTYILKAEDLKNPLYSTNMEKLIEMKQKQKLRELDLATTSEQKQEIIKSLSEDCEPFDENPHDYFVKVLSGFLQEDKYVNFLSIRKGKMLLLRILPCLALDKFPTQLCDLWIKVFLSIPIVGRKDATGDNLFIRFYPFFKRFIQSADMDVILEITTNLLEVLSLNVSRSTPIIGKQLLNFIVANKFGVSSLVAVFIRVEELLSEGNVDDHQQTQWFSFLTSWAESLLVPKVVLETPMEQIPIDLFNKHCSHSNLTEDNRILLEKRLTTCS